MGPSGLMMVTLAIIRSVTASSTPSLLKSAQALRKALEPVVLVKFTVTLAPVCPCATKAGSEIASSSSDPVVSSPSAVGVAVATHSGSVKAPNFRVPSKRLLADPKVEKSPKSVVGAVMVRRMSSTSPLPARPVGPALLSEVSRNRQATLPTKAPGGTLNRFVVFRLLLKLEINRLVMICSPASVRIPLLLKSTQPLR